MSLSLNQYQEEFLDHLRFQKRYSAHTITSYQNDLAAFIIFLYEEFGEVDINQIKASFIRSWLAGMKDNEMSSRSINRKISTLRSFFKYLLKNEIVKVSPVTAIISPKTPKRLPQFVEENDTYDLFTQISFSDDFKGLTEKIILEVLYNTGMRKAELIGLKEYNIDYMNSQVKVLGKGNKERIIPINKELSKSLQFYIAEKKKLFGKDEENTFFVSNKGLPLDPKTIYNIVKKYLSQVTTIEKRSPHILRHSFATHLMNNGADLNAVKELLGHSSLAATQVYTHNTIEKLKDVYKKAHPKA